jgi:hypothetical protein
MLSDVETIARRHRIPVDRARHRRWAAWMCLEDGRRWAALRHYGAAVLAGDPASVGRAAVAVMNPHVAGRRTTPTDAWALEAQGWLDSLAQVPLHHRLATDGNRRDR